MTMRKRCGLPMLRQHAHATCWSCRLVATSRWLVGWRSSILRYYPPDEAKRQSDPVPGAPSFGEESVVDRGRTGDGSCRRMRPAGPSQAARWHSRVAWWDPNVLALDVEENVGVRQQRILEADESGAEVARGEQTYIQWKEGRSAAIAQASRPSIKVQTVTAFAAGAGLSAAGFGARPNRNGIARWY